MAKFSLADMLTPMYEFAAPMVKIWTSVHSSPSERRKTYAPPPSGAPTQTSRAANKTDIPKPDPGADAAAVI